MDHINISDVEHRISVINIAVNLKDVYDLFQTIFSHMLSLLIQNTICYKKKLGKKVKGFYLKTALSILCNQR